MNCGAASIVLASHRIAALSLCDHKWPHYSRESAPHKYTQGPPRVPLLFPCCQTVCGRDWIPLSPSIPPLLESWALTPPPVFLIFLGLKTTEPFTWGGCWNSLKMVGLVLPLYVDVAKVLCLCHLQIGLLTCFLLGLYWSLWWKVSKGSVWQPV